MEGLDVLAGGEALDADPPAVLVRVGLHDGEGATVGLEHGARIQPVLANGQQPDDDLALQPVGLGDGPPLEERELGQSVNSTSTSTPSDRKSTRLNSSH